MLKVFAMELRFMRNLLFCFIDQAANPAHLPPIRNSEFFGYSLLRKA